MAVITPVREETRTPLTEEGRGTRTGPPAAPPRESRERPTPPRWRRWLVVVLALAVVGTIVGLVLVSRDDGATEAGQLEEFYDAYGAMLGDDADALVTERQEARVEDALTGVESVDALDEYYGQYGVVLQDGAVSAEEWERVAEAQARDHEIDRIRTQAEWWSTVPDGADDHEVARFRSAAAMWLALQEADA